MGHKELENMMTVKTLKDIVHMKDNAKRLSYVSVSIPDLETDPTRSLKKNNYGQTT
jgi:hypothetical protein